MSSDSNLSSQGSKNQPPQEVDSLTCLEGLDRASPDLWPDEEAGDISDLIPGLKSSRSSPNYLEFQKEMEEDINMLHEFSSLTTVSLMEKVKCLQNLAFQLGLDECREMTRGKFLQILPTKPKK